MRKFALMLVLLAASSQLYSQETKYIVDELVVQLRSGPSFNHRILKGLISGTKLTVLETSEDEKWTRVKTRGELEGWIPAQYLTTEPAARNVLISVNKQLDSLQQQNAALKQQLSDIAEKEHQAQQQVNNLSNNSESLSKELEHIKEVSANAVQLDIDNKRLVQENQVLKNEMDVLSTDNQRLHDARESEEFMNGAFAVLIGVFITLLVPRLWPKKSSEWA